MTYQSGQTNVLTGSTVGHRHRVRAGEPSDQLAHPQIIGHGFRVVTCHSGSMWSA